MDKGKVADKERKESILLEDKQSTLFEISRNNFGFISEPYALKRRDRPFTWCYHKLCFSASLEESVAMENAHGCRCGN